MVLFFKINLLYQPNDNYVLMLQKLALKNKVWFDFAFRISQDYDLANDLVQDMYLYFHDKDIEVNNSYVCRKIYHLFLDHCRKEAKINNISIEDLHFLEDDIKGFEPDDVEYDILEKYNDLDWLEKELIQEHHINEKSLRQIQREYPLIKYGYAYLIISKAKKKLNG